MKILELKKGPVPVVDYLKKGFIAYDINSEALDSVALRALGHQIEYQLIERMTFIREDDLIVGRLLFELGTICYKLSNTEEALRIYRVADHYGFSSEEMTVMKQELILQKKQETRDHRYKELVQTWRVFKKSTRLKVYVVVLLVLLPILVLLGLKIFRRL